LMVICSLPGSSIMQGYGIHFDNSRHLFRYQFTVNIDLVYLLYVSKPVFMCPVNWNHIYC
jgi:hypothetical protein